MKLLLHTCCAPCAIYPIELAKTSGYDSITSFFYNPNIHPTQEFNKRKDEMNKLCKHEKLNVIDIDYNQAEYFKEIKDFDNTERRCFSCWSLRLKKAAQKAKENNFDAFSTTLLGSPYQNHEVLKRICTGLSRDFNLKFYYEDFRKGFRDAHRKAKIKGFYCQNYCGCIFSMVEREVSNRKPSLDLVRLRSPQVARDRQTVPRLGSASLTTSRSEQANQKPKQ